MRATIRLSDISVEVVRKDIRNLHLSVHPPTGRVTISAPAHLGAEAIRAFAITRLGWIRRHQRKLTGQERETKREYLDRESHYVWGRRYLLEMSVKDAPPDVLLKARKIIMQVRPKTEAARRHVLLEAWYRAQIRDEVPDLITKWEKRLGVKVAKVHVQRMRTRWGSCNAAHRAIRLNTDLARKPRQCLEYIIVHEMMHLLVRSHGEEFRGLMDQHLPKWRHLRDVLNSEPLAHTEWMY